MNQRELVNLIIGTIVIIGVYMIITSGLQNLHERNANTAWYQLDLYSDHPIITPTPMPPSTPTPVIGSPDIDFGNNGIVVSDFGERNGARSVAIQPDGKIVVGGYSGQNFAMIRYNPDGTPDMDFGVEGRVTTFGLLNTYDSPDMALTTDGKIVLASGEVYGTLPYNGGFTILRYTDAGLLDSSFGTNGRTTVPLADLYSNGLIGVAVQTDNKIVVTGASDQDFVMARLNTDGNLDTTFNNTQALTGTGVITSDFGTDSEAAHDLTIQPDGKIIVVGESGFDFALARYNSNGKLDTGFGIAGKVTTSIHSIYNSNDIAWSVVVQPDNKILLAGVTDSHLALVRYNSDGSLDTAFGTGGKVIGDYDQTRSVTLATDGKIIVVGGYGLSLVVSRYNNNGTIDKAFGINGKVMTSVHPHSFNTGYDVAIRVDKKIVVVGETQQGRHSDFLVVQYIADRPHLVIRKSVNPPLFTVPQLLTYSLSIINNGNLTATNVVVTDVVPTGSSFVSAPPGGVLTDDTVSWNVPIIEPGTMATFTLVVSASDTLINDQYGALGDNTAQALGLPITTPFLKYRSYLPVIQKQDLSNPNDPMPAIP